MAGIYDQFFFFFALFKGVPVTLGAELLGLVIVVHDGTDWTVFFRIGQDFGVISIIYGGPDVGHVIKVFYDIFQ